MIRFKNKLRVIWYIIFTKERFGIMVFKEEPTIGDTISVGEMIAKFNKKQNEPLIP